MAVTIPSTTKIFEEASQAWGDMEALDNEIKRQVEAFRAFVQQQSAEEREALRVTWVTLKNQAEQTARLAIVAFAKAVYEGEAGQGTLVVLGQDRFSVPDGEPFYRLARVADLSDDQRYAAELARTGYLGLSCFRGMLEVERYVGFLSFSRQQHGVLDPHASGVLENWVPKLVEVALGEPTEKELTELLAKVRAWRSTMHPADQIRLFRRVVNPQAGDTFRVQSLSHDSGVTSATLVHLPTGRWAVIAENIGDDGERTWCEGVVTNPAVEIHVSGRYGGSCEIEGEADQPTLEEQAFLDERYELSQDKE